MPVTVLRPKTLLPIDVQGEFRLDGPEARSIKLTAHGSRLRLAAPGWVSLHGLGPRSLLEQRRILATAVGALRTLSLSLDIFVDGRRAFGLGEGIRTTLLARLLGLTSADIRLSNVVTFLRSRAAAPYADRK